MQLTTRTIFFQHTLKNAIIFPNPEPDKFSLSQQMDKYRDRYTDRQAKTKEHITGLTFPQKSCGTVQSHILYIRICKLTNTQHEQISEFYKLSNTNSHLKFFLISVISIKNDLPSFHFLNLCLIITPLKKNVIFSKEKVDEIHIYLNHQYVNSGMDIVQLKDFFLFLTKQ